ncbi:MAG: hypothetical protein ACOCRX_02735 [Candidatus Woesearchaeota archaeon]
MTKLISVFLVFFIFFIPLVVNGEEDISDLDKDDIKNPFYDYRKTEEDNKENSETDNENIENTEESGEVSVDKSEEKNNIEVKTGYKNTETTNKIIEIKNKRIEPDFYWQGLISAKGKYQILLEYENESHILSIGDKLNGYKVINIDSAKVTLAKDNYIYYINMRGE